MTSPSTMKRIRLELARSKDHPAGSASHGYELVAPLDASGHIDPVEWNKRRGECTVLRFWGGVETRGRLVHQPGGSEHARWVFDYDASTRADDEPGFRFGAHAFMPGEYVSVVSPDGEQHTFRVASVLTAR